MPDFEDNKNWAAKPHVVLVVDESGSMTPSRRTTVSAMNDYLQGLKSSLPDDARVTVVKFDSAHAQYSAPYNGMPPASGPQVRISKIFDQVRLADVRPITENDYRPQGGTPLHDAIGRTVVELDIRLASDPAPVYFAILTDGEENTSREYRLETVRAMIDERTKAGWTFAFLGVEINSYAEASKFGIKAGDTVTLSRDTLTKGLAGMSRGVGMRYASAMNIAASGATLGDYVTATQGMETFSAEEKAEVEKK